MGRNPYTGIPTATIKLELGIDAQRFIQQVQVHNGQIEQQVEEGIKQALDEIAATDNFVTMIKNETISSLGSIVHQAVFSHRLKEKIRNMIDEKIERKMMEYADKIAEQVTRNLV